MKPDNMKKEAKNYVDEATMTAKVKAKLAADRLINALNIHVNTNKGAVVTLTGTVPSQDAVNKAQQIARSVEGVKDVKLDLKIEPK